MRIVASIFFAVLFLPSAVWSQALPKEGSTLNYRIIGFSPAPGEKEKAYSIEIAAGNYYSADAFKKNIIKTISCSEEKVIVEVPAFGKQYTWRTLYGKSNAVKKGQLHHFSTGIISAVDTALNRVRILKKARKYEDSYIFSDATMTLYDMSGNPVWYLPSQGSYCRDLKLSPLGTITMLLNNWPVEVNYNGDTLWSAAGNDDTKQGSKKDNFHHAFSRLANGNYMTLGLETVTLPGDSTSVPGRRINFGTVVEFDSTGKQVWSWSSSKYYKTTDFFAHSPANTDVHENAFYFDEKLKVIYVSFKFTSTILKIKYPEGTVLNAFGANDYASMRDPGKNLFCGQHSCSSPDPGSLYLFNNNICNPGSFPSVVLLKESGKNAVSKVWEYECAVEKDAGKAPVKGGNEKGGNVINLADSSLFVSMPNGQMFIVTRNKDLLWSAVCENRETSQSGWDDVVLYRASIINRKELERLIWDAKSK